MTAAPRVAIVHLGRRGALGAVRRLTTMRDLFAAAGATTHEVALTSECRLHPRDVMRPGLVDALRGDIPLEALSWSTTSAVERLHGIDPDVILCSTLRAFSPAFASLGRPVVLDYVDQLSDSYRDRATAHRPGPTRLALRGLGRAMARVERRARGSALPTVAAGWSDAGALHATWVPNTATVVPRQPGASFDLGFVGSLSYPPNVEAVRRLARLWPGLQARRPGTTLLIAGARPSDAVRALALQHGWTLRADFDELGSVLSSMRVSVVPLTHASGIQCKVLDAAAHGVPQVVDAVALLGFAPGFPARVASDDTALVDACLELLDDPAVAASLGASGQAHVAAHYSVERWLPWAVGTLDATGR